MIYLDNAATQKPIDDAVQAANEAMSRVWFNPSASYSGAKQARELVENARTQCAKAAGCPADRFFFTSGGTESINTALFALAAKGRRFGKHAISLSVEHDATLRSLDELKRQGWEISLAPPGPGGQADIEKLLSLCREDTVLLTLSSVNNETGAVNDVSAIAALCRKKSPNLLVHCDAVQSYARLDFPLDGIDCLSVSGHKIGALKGVGGLYVRKGLDISPRVFGGGQENGLRSGTEAVPAIASFGAAAAHRHDAPELISAFRRMMDQACPDWTAISPDDGSPYIFSFSPGKGASEVWVRLLSDKGIFLSAGSACARGKASHVIKALGLRPEIARSALRISFSCSTTEAELCELSRAISDNLRFFR